MTRGEQMYSVILYEYCTIRILTVLYFIIRFITVLYTCITPEHCCTVSYTDCLLYLLYGYGLNCVRMSENVIRVHIS